MKKTLIAISIVGLVAVVAGSAAAQAKLGGYKLISKTDARAQEAAEFAVEAQTKKSGKKQTLESIFKAESQTVAGINYRLCLEVTSEGEGNEADVVGFVEAIVYVDLKKNSKLTSWKTSDCGDDDDGK